ncbi:DUF2442 domain-containing protein [Fibrobacter sp. UWB12]|uniref:DUF2442 domain-containing protein n=1 Tax=Fibrobacter sp. UWB12 TaxID=1896203 RepID=UPI00091077D6|nr:DUF2442 domain-containing protein [Fibrobacter sp. UWB12]SHK47768.1 Protein of unknown function [Fibrobacter sp. UWB12]
MLHVTEAKYIGDYKISVAFNDGCRIIADFEKVVKSDHRAIVQQLANINTFKDFSLQAHTITWSNGVDFAPEFIKSLQKVPENAAKWSKERLNTELEKGYNDMLKGRTRPAAMVLSDVKKKYKV